MLNHVCLRTLNQIAEFAQAQVDRARFLRVVNSVADGIKIREYRERLAQATNRFEVNENLLLHFSALISKNPL
jgi:hypothetical protein